MTEYGKKKQQIELPPLPIIAIAMVIVAGIAGIALYATQSSSVSQGLGPNQPISPIPTAILSEKNYCDEACDTRTPKTQEPVETFKDSGWYKLGEEQYFEVSKYKIKLKLVVIKDKILVNAESKFSLPSDRDIQIRINLRKDGVALQSEILKPWNVYKEVNLPLQTEWQPEINVIYKTPATTTTPHKLT